jgi:uncharacterized Zn-binding protein involved in type VI secretion
MGMPAARVGDPHICPAVTGVVPHVGGVIMPPGAVTVIIGGQPAARITDMTMCAGPPGIVIKGSMTVLTMGLPQARMLDPAAHGGMIVRGWSTVLVGG